MSWGDWMIKIDTIMKLIDWNNSIEEQAQGIALAKDVKCISAFLQPCNKNYNKNVWDNCAKILSERTDDELAPHLLGLMEWLQDMNWPGAFCIFDRLQEYIDDASYNVAFDSSLKHAQALEDAVWEDNLRMLQMQKNSPI